MPEDQMGNGTNDRHKPALEFINNVTTNADQVQTLVLSSILTRNADTEYLKRHGLRGRTNRATFKKCLPIIIKNKTAERCIPCQFIVVHKNKTAEHCIPCQFIEKRANIL